MLRYLQAIGIGAAIGAVVAIFKYPVWEAWISEFQTLITGLAAVLAAAFTIRMMDKTIQTMERTDQAAQRRHDELVASAKKNEMASERKHRQLLALTLRSDRLKVSRSVEPFLPAITQAIADVDDIISPVGLDDVGKQMVFVAGVDNFATAVARITGNPQLKEAYELFEGKLALAIGDTDGRAAYLLRAAKKTFQKIKDDTVAGKPDVEIFVVVQDDIRSMGTTARLLKLCLIDVQMGLKSLADLYLAAEYDFRANT